MDNLSENDMVTLDDRILAIIPIDSPSPIAYMNVFEDGDIWLKIRGCDDCPSEQRIRCCGSCVMSSSAGCFLHTDGRGQNKPISCVINPTPDQGKSGCVLEFKCIQGSMKGKIRRMVDNLDDLNKVG